MDANLRTKKSAGVFTDRAEYLQLGRSIYSPLNINTPPDRAHPTRKINYFLRDSIHHPSDHKTSALSTSANSRRVC